MKAILRNAVLAAGVASIAVTGMQPASANHGSVRFTGTATIAKFGQGASTCKADLKVTGTVHGHTLTDVDAEVSCTLNEPPSTCPVTGTASGTVTATADDGTALSIDFTWSRVGATASISTTGDLVGSGAAAFKVTSPVGNPCGANNVVAEVVGYVSS